ncbi:MAG: hypothetical protein ACM3U1_02590 [Chloroflexota bacterium]
MVFTALLLGVISLLGMFVGIIPCFGWFNWLNLPLAFIGLILSLYLYVSRKDQPRGLIAAALGMNGLAAVVGVIRLMIGGGVL